MAKYTYHINLDERGDFYADVRNTKGRTVYEIRADENGEVWQIVDGFMRHPRDTDGLEEYLHQMRVIPANTSLHLVV